jgi:hypothetical protein
VTEPRALPAVTTWTTDQVHFQAWLAVPSGAREPRSQRELAAQLEVREATLSDWKKLPGWHDAVYGLALGRLIGDLVPVLHAMAREAKGGSLPHAQWLFELAGKWDPRLKHEHTGEAGAPLRIVIETVDDRTR